jgi:hypothetical protein
VATPESDAIKAAVLTMRATVYQRTGGTGPYNNAVKTDLACFLDTLSALSPMRTSTERAAVAAMRTLMYDVDYDLQQQGTQIEVTSPSYYAGKRWNVILDTDRPAMLPDFDEPIAIEIDVRKAN